MNHNIAVRSLQVFNHIIGLAGIVYLFMGASAHYAWIALFTYWTIGVLGINIGFHRLLAHRSFNTYPVIEKILSVIGVITSVGSPFSLGDSTSDAP